MKKVILMITIVLFSTKVTVLAQEVVYQFLKTEWISTSEGTYKCRIWYRGQNNGKEVASEEISDSSPLDKISNGQLECVNRMLNQYKNNKGDTYKIYIEWLMGGYWRRVSVVCEFTSDKNYRYWLRIYY